MNKKILKLRKFYEDILNEDVLPFWSKSELVDQINGGYTTCIDREGKKYSDDKSVIFQGRCLYSFSKLCYVYGKRKEWLENAQLGASFIKKHCFDKDGRMFAFTNAKGKTYDKNSSFYSEANTIYGLTEYYLLFKKEDDLALAEHCFDTIVKQYYDGFNKPDNDSKLRKYHSHGDIMLLISTAQALKRVSEGKDSYYDEIIKEGIRDFFSLHYKDKLKCVIENAAYDGIMHNNPVDREVCIGHSFENAWFIINYAYITKDKKTMNKAIKVIDWTFDRAWDKKNGGFPSLVDALDWPSQHADARVRSWWTHLEAMIALLVAYKVTNKEEYFAKFMKVNDYFFKKFNDKKYGEFFEFLNEKGKPIDTEKGSFYKGPFHIVRALIIYIQILDSIIDNSFMPELL